MMSQRWHCSVRCCEGNGEGWHPSKVQTWCGLANYSIYE